MADKPKKSAAKKKPDAPRLKAAKLRYASFLKDNPASSLFGFRLDGKEEVAIQKPWGDKSLAIRVPEDDAELAAALKELLFPPRYTAIYHKDLRALEVIWTAYKLDQPQKDLEDRKFALAVAGEKHECEFTDSSARLLEVAKHILPVEISSTSFRNMMSFTALATRQKGAAAKAIGRPLSFWIRDVDWDEEGLIKLIRHINFYLKYYDADSPVIEVHPVADPKAAPKNRYFEGFEFPAEIVSPPLDTKLMIMFSSGFSATASTSFLNLYRVVEYVALDYTHADARREVRQIISRPHALHDVDKTATDLMLVLREIKTEREQDAIPRFLKEVVKPEQLWRELEPNRAFFTAPTEFEGGLRIDPIATDKTDASTFGSTGVDQFARVCTKIRNGLAHGRDKVSADSILPTSHNFDLLRPWVNALTMCAGEVVVWSARH